MGRGRKPTPTKLKILRGNPGKRALPADEPQAPAREPDRPERLQKKAGRADYNHAEAAAKEWDYYAPQLLACGLLSGLDRAAFAAFCDSVADYERARALLAACPEIVLDEEGVPAVSKTWLRLHAAAERARRAVYSGAAEFGLSPAMRARIGAHQSEAAKGGGDDGFQIFDAV